MSRVASLQVSHGESVLKPAAMIPDRFMTWALTMFLASVSHRRISAEINRHLAAATTTSVKSMRHAGTIPYGYEVLSTRPNAGSGSSSGACWPSRTTPY